VATIRDEILGRRDRRITFARFMQRALTEPGLGYYATSRLRPTRSGDFLTAPELHPLFGRCLGRFLAAAWEGLGRPRPLVVHEHGAGRGRLRDTAAGALDDAGAAVEWIRLDLPDRTDAGTRGRAHVVLANEFLDALPVHRLVGGAELREAYVGWADGWFSEVMAEPSTPDLAAHLEADGVELAAGQRAEVCLAAPGWLREVAATMAEGGILLVIDYGHDAAELYGPRRMAGSLLTYRGHEVANDPFATVGHSDITAHVDISALERAARAGGLELLGSTTQAAFLAELGLGGLLAELGRQPGTDPGAYLEARAAVARLLDPRHLGGFRVLAWGCPGRDGATPALPGFGDAP
jgi:SAM-dependent MidA family methyltransferase